MPTGARFAQLRRLFEEVCELDPSARREYLRRSGVDTDVVAEVEALVASETLGLQRVSLPVAAILAALPETELDAGDRIGAWRLHNKLASGGMGTVYRAERADGHFQQQAAIKLLRGFPTVDALARLAAERQILAGLQHPHIARLLDGGATPGGQPYLVMEFVDGVPVDTWCRARALDLPARLRLFRNICRAVAFAHQRLIVHCDLKPSNVLVRADGSPVLLDFGIARALDLSREGESDAYYSPGYASPEQIAGAPVTVASDVYSLGLILFELAAGRKARLDVDDRTVTELSQAARRPSELVAADCPWRGSLRGDLDAIILRACAQRPALRYASADALAEDIERYLDMKPVAARAPTLRYRYARLIRRRWPLFAASLAIFVMAAVFSWRIVNERDRALVAEREAKIQAETAQQVSEFLISVFEFANPEKNPARRDISAREMLEESTRRIGNSLEDRPAVRARLYDVLARAWDMLGQPKRAIELYRESVAQWRLAGPAHLQDRAESLSNLAVMQTNHNLTAESESSAREALALREAQTKPDPLDLADSWNTLALVLVGLHRFDEAERYFQRALDVRRRVGSPKSVASTLHNLALLNNNKGELEKSIALYGEALAIKRQVHGGDRHPDSLITLTNYAKVLSQHGRTSEAIPLLRQVLVLRRELDGYESGNVSGSYNEIGSALHDAGQFRAAADSYREALRIDALLIGRDQPDYAKPLNNLASALEDMGDYAAAEPLFRESLQIRRKAMPGDDPMVARAENNLARLLLRAGRLADARPLADHALAARRARLGEGHVETAKSELLEIELLRREGRLDEADAALGKVDKSTARFTPSMRAQREREHAMLAMARAQPAQALVAARAAHAALLEQLQATHPLAAASAIDLAEILLANGAQDEARALFAANSAVAIASFVEDAPVRRRTQVLQQRFQ